MGLLEKSPPPRYLILWHQILPALDQDSLMLVLSAPQDTPFGYTMSVIGGKWKMVIIYLLAENQPVRFNEMQRQIGTITYKINT